MKPIVAIVAACIMLPSLASAGSSRNRSHIHNTKNTPEKSSSVSESVNLFSVNYNSGNIWHSQLPPDAFKSKLPVEIQRSLSTVSPTNTNHQQVSNTSNVASVLNLLLYGGNSSSVKDLVIVGQQKQREITCLALNVYHEARGSTRDDKRSVAFVTLNRLKAGGQFGDSVCDVVTQRKSARSQPQFSWITKRDLTPRDEAAWVDAQNIAFGAYSGQFRDPTNGALYFWQPEKAATYSWMQNGSEYKRIGAHMYMHASR